MAKIRFDIKYRDKIESGKYKVVTEDDEPARIICWDSTINKERPIIAIVFDDQIEQYKADGRYDNDYDTSNYDLFIVTPEPELSEFEKACKKLYNEGHDDGLSGDKLSNESIKESAAELLAIAIDANAKELYKGLKQSKLDKDSIPYHLIEFMCNLYTCRNWKEIEETAEAYVTRIKAAALKDLPRWKKDKSFETEGTFMGVKGREYFIVKDGYSISVAELIKKLPGFKED